MKIKSKKIIIKYIDGRTWECECLSLSSIKVKSLIESLLENGEIGESCKTCPVHLSNPTFKCEYRILGRNGCLIDNNNISLFEAGFRDGDCIKIIHPITCQEFAHAKSLIQNKGSNSTVTKFKIKSLEGTFFDWEISCGEESYNINSLFDDLIFCKVLPTNSEMKKIYGSVYSKYGVLLQNGTSYSQDCDLTLQELGFRSGDEIWLGLIPAEFDHDDPNLPLKGIVVTN